MTKKEAIKRLQRCKRNLELGKVIGAVSEEGADERIEAYNLAIKALDLLTRLEGFKYVTTDVMLKEHELAHFDVYKTGWNDAIEAVKVASDRPLSEIFNAIKETEAYSEYKEEEE